MTRYWLMNPIKLIESERLEELSQMNLFGIPMRVHTAGKDSIGFLEKLNDDVKFMPLSFVRKGQYAVPMGNKILIYRFGFPKAIVTINSAIASPYKELTYEESQSLPLTAPGSVFNPADIVSLYSVEKICLNPLEKEIDGIIKAWEDFSSSSSLTHQKS